MHTSYRLCLTTLWEDGEGGGGGGWFGEHINTRECVKLMYVHYSISVTSVHTVNISARLPQNNNNACTVSLCCTGFYYA